MQPPRRLSMVVSTAFGQSGFARAVNLIVMTLSIMLVWQALSWGIFRAVAPWSAPSLCGAGSGACWPFLVEKLPLILFGTFPFEERWRPLIASICLFAMSCVTLFQWISWRWQAVGWLFSLVLFIFLMGGGAGYLKAVPHAQWNGLPVLLFLGTVSLAAALPTGLGLLLCRQSGNALLRIPAILVIEVLRGIPMVAVLFFGVFVLPMLIGQNALAPIHAALIVLIFFHGAYVAEDLRSGLQSIPRGQWEAPAALGLNRRQILRLVILPQAIRAATPALTNTAIGGFKDTSLIVLVGLHDLLSTSKMAVAEPRWQAYALEAFVFVGALFFLLNGLIAWAGRRLEHRMQAGRRLRPDRPAVRL
jgi:general L-amino acid transport system permease protein